MNTKPLNRIFFQAMYIMVIAAIAFSATGSVYAQDEEMQLPRVFANLTDDSIRYEFTAPYATVTFSIYDTPYGDLLWEEDRTADETGFTWVSIWDHRQDLKPGMFIVVSDDIHRNELEVELVSIDLVDADNNILAGKAVEGRPVWVVANNDPEQCGTLVIAEPGDTWQVNFNDLPCADITDDLVFYAQVMDAEDDTSEANPAFIEGWHDYDQGDVPNWACNVGGWAVDTDDRERDLDIRVISDEFEIASTIAGTPREDLAGACGVDGSCGFEINLWSLITPYEEHQITVQAKDNETGQWFDLNDSPKTLTCRTYDIYAFDPETGATKQITNLPDTHEYNPRWSPDGKKIVHDVWDLDWSSHGIYITNVNTGMSTPLAGAEGGSYPAWSPNGKWIAFDRGADNDYRVFIVPPTGGVPRLVREDAFMASWAPNGNRLTFHQPSDGSIRTVTLDGDSETIVAESGNGPAWSPDGEWIAFEVDGDIWKVRVNNGGNPLGEPIQLTSNPLWEGRPTWSFNSKTIAFHAGMGNDTDIWTIPVAGGEATWLTGAPNFGDYDANYSIKGQSTTVSYSSFSPDGQAARQWVAAYTSDPPTGTFGEGTHPYHFDFEWSAPELGSWSGQEGEFVTSNDAEMYSGYVLLRGPAELHGINYPDGLTCEEAGDLNPSQPTRFLVGWLAETGESAYPEARAHFDSITATALWDDGSAELARHEIIPFNEGDWFNYVCAFTEAPPVPTFVAYMPVTIVGYDWPMGDTIDLSINDGEYTAQAEVGNADWDPTVVLFELWRDDFTMEAGDHIVMTDETAHVSKELWVTNLAVTDFDLGTGKVFGTYNPAYSLWVWLYEGEGQTPETDPETGKWVATFDPLQPGSMGGATQWDEDGDGTSIDFQVPNPEIRVWLGSQRIEGYRWPLGVDITLSIFDPASNATYSETKQAEGDLPDTFVQFLPSEFVLVPGQEVTMSADGITKTHVVLPVSITSVDVDLNVVEGTASSAGKILLCIYEGGCEPPAEVFADGSGYWQNNYGDEFNIQPGFGMDATEFDDDGDGTSFDYWVPKQTIFLRPSCGDTYTVQAGSLLEIRYGSWVAIGEDLAIQNAEHLTVEMVLNGETVTGAQQPVVPRSEIPCGLPLDDAYGVFYVTQVGPLSPGTYVAEVTWSFDQAVTDGYDANGDGQPDWYGPDVVSTHEFTLIVP